MKRFIKFFCILSAVFAVFGLALCMIGAVLGADFSEMYTVARNGFSFWSRQKYSVEQNGYDNKEQFSTDLIESLRVDFSYGTVDIITYDGEDILVDVSNASSDYTCKDNSGVLTINDNKYNSWLSAGDDATYLMIQIPESHMLNELKLTIGAAQVTINNLTVENLKIDVGAGTFEGTNLSVADEASLEVGAGTFNLYNFECQDIDLDCGVGKAYIEGVVYGDVKATAGAGEVEFNLIGDEEDFDYELSCSVGNISLNGQSYNGLDRKKKIDNGGSQNFKADCSVGRIKIVIE